MTVVGRTLAGARDDSQAEGLLKKSNLRRLGFSSTHRVAGASAVFAPGFYSYRQAAGASTATTHAVRWRYVLVLLPLLPFFGESFHYVKGLYALWALSKVFPLLSLPLAVFLLRGERPPIARQLLLSLLWLVLVPSFTAVFSFQQDFFTGLTAQVKLLPLLYFFTFLGLLRWLKPSTSELATGFLICSAVTFVLLLGFWVAAPQSWYSTTYQIGDSPIFSVDSRGDRIRMPMYFGMIGLFYCFRRFLFGVGLLRRSLWLLAATAGFALVLAAVRTRAMVLGLAATVAVNALRFARPRTRVFLAILVPVLLLLLFSVPYLHTAFATDPESGFDVRWTTFSEALDFLGTNPLRWLVGVGTISSLDPGGMIAFFNHFFFLADISWLGVVFEFGLVGALLFLLLPVRGLLLFRQLDIPRENAFLGSLQDYLLYLLLISPLVAPTLAPGEFAVILAIFVAQWDGRRERRRTAWR
jgi:hypothetical protein